MKSPESGKSNNLNKDPLLITHDKGLDSKSLSQKVLDAAHVYEESVKKIQENIGGTEEGFTRSQARNSLVTMNQAAGLAPYMTKTQSKIQSYNASSGFELVQNPEAVALVAADMRRQKTVEEKKLSLQTVDENGVHVLDYEDAITDQPSFTTKQYGYSGEIKVPQVNYAKQDVVPEPKASRYDLDENIIRQQAAFDKDFGSEHEVNGPGKAVFANMADQLSKYGNSIDFTEESTTGYRIIKQGDQTKKDAANELDIDLVQGEARALKEEQDKITVNNFTDEEQSKKKAEWLAARVEEVKKTISKPTAGDELVYPSSIDIDLGEIEKKAEEDKENAAKKKKSDWGINGPIENWGEDPGFVRPINGDVAPIKELVNGLSKQEATNEIFATTETVEKKRRMTEEEYNVQVEIWKKSLEGAKVAVENAEKALLESRQKSKESLKAMGLTNVEKGLAALKKVRPGYMMALGLVLGASGLGAVSVGLSALTFTGKGYSERREALLKEGKKESKYWTLTKSAGIGILLALGTSQLSHLVGDAISEYAPGVIDNFKHFFSPDVLVTPPHGVVTPPVASFAGDPGIVADVVPEAVQEITPEVVPGITSEVMPDIASGVTPGTSYTVVSESLSPEIMTDMTSPINLNETYIMNPGDNADSILRRVLNTVPELNSLPEEGKLKFISDLKEQWTTPISSASTPNWSLKEMMGGVAGSEVHHLNHVRDSFVTLGERANIITTFKN